MKYFCQVLALLACVGASTARAQLPAARLNTVFPPGGQQGTDVEVTLSGVDLDDLTTLHFSTPLLSAEPRIDPASGKPVANAFVIHVAKDLRPGAYDVRAIGRFGVTNPRAFVVDRDTPIAWKAGKTSPEAALELGLGSSVYAQAADKADEYFKISLKANQRVLFAIDAQAIDSRMDPVMVLFDAAGREITRDGQGDCIDFTPASDGVYVLQVHDVLYRGGVEYFYRLRAEPPPATTQSVVLIGDDNAEDVASLQARWCVPSIAGMLDGLQRFGFAPQFLLRTERPTAVEQSDNDDPAKAQIVTVPVQVSGQFFPRDDRDWFRFDAKKSQPLWIEVTSNRFTGITDPMIVVQRITKTEKGEETAADVKEAYEPENVPNMPREFNAAHHDPAFVFSPTEDGPYRMMVRDLTNTSGDDARRVYFLSIAPTAQVQDFRLVAWPQAPQPFNQNPPITQVWGSNLRPGGVMPIRVLMFPAGGFVGDITLKAEGLPPGVSSVPVTLSAGTNTATLLIAADEKASSWSGPIRIVGTATISAGRVSHMARAGSMVWTVPNQDLEPLRSRIAQELVISVTSGEVEPITVRAAEEKVWENSIAGKIEVPLKVTRRSGYNGVVKLKPAASIGSIIAMPEIDVAAGASDTKLVLDAAALKLAPGNYSVYLQATSTAPYDRDPAKRAAVQAGKDAADKATAELAAGVAKAKETLATAKTPEEKDAATKAVAVAEEKVKQNEQARSTATEQLKALAPKDHLAYGYSMPIAIRITPSPITLAAPAASGPVKAGGKIDVPVTITRLYGFAEPVDMSVVIPPGVVGISVANVQIAGNAAQASLAVQTSATTKPGDYTLTLSAAVKQNNVPIKLEQPLRVQVAAP